MALALIRTGNLPATKVLRNFLGVFVNPIRFGGYWNYKYMPGKHPKTKEEYAEAAKKYGMSPLEYQPYPEEHCLGDYPKLPDVGAESKDPFYPYDYPDSKRNFNEPMHYKFEMIGEDRVDISMKPRFSVATQWLSFLFAIGVSAAIFLYFEQFLIGRPVTSKQYPGQGNHYLFC